LDCYETKRVIDLAKINFLSDVAYSICIGCSDFCSVHRTLFREGEAKHGAGFFFCLWIS